MQGLFRHRKNFYRDVHTTVPDSPDHQAAGDKVQELRMSCRQWHIFAYDGYVFAYRQRGDSQTDFVQFTWSMVESRLPNVLDSFLKCLMTARMLVAGYLFVMVQSSGT